MRNAEQLEYWNGEAGRRWARDDDTMARLLRPICEALLDHAALEGCRNALDIGCGGGSQSIMLAQRLGESARVQRVERHRDSVRKQAAQWIVELDRQANAPVEA